jgi:hypothetical protein
LSDREETEMFVSALLALAAFHSGAIDQPLAAARQTCPIASSRQFLEAPEEWKASAINADADGKPERVLELMVAGGQYACEGATIGSSHCTVTGPAIVRVTAPRKTAYFEVPKQRQASITAGVPNVDPIRCELMTPSQATLAP